MADLIAESIDRGDMALVHVEGERWVVECNKTGKLINVYIREKTLVSIQWFSDTQRRTLPAAVVKFLESCKVVVGMEFREDKGPLTKRYLVFRYPHFYPAGGMDDFVGACDSFDQVDGFFVVGDVDDAPLDELGQVYDTVDGITYYRNFSDLDSSWTTTRLIQLW